MKFIQRYQTLILFSIPVLSLLMHLHVFNLDLIGIHVWRQTQTQTVINNFFREDWNILNPRYLDRADTDRIQRMEFPIMQWMFAVFFKLLGNHIAITRALSFIIGLFSVAGMYSLSKNIFKNTSVATLCAWTFNFSPVFYYYTVNPLPDNLALCCGIWSLAFFFRFTQTRKLFPVVLSSLFLCIATLAKLPFILYGSVALGYLGVQFFKKKSISTQLIASVLLIYGIMILPALMWYVKVIPTWGGNGVVKGITENRQAWGELLSILNGTLVSTLPELLINYGSVLFFLAGFYWFFKRKGYKNPLFPSLLACSIAVVFYFFFEMNMISLVHDYYLFPFLPLLFLIVAYGAVQLLQSRLRFMRILSVVALTVLPVTAFLRADTRWNTQEPGFNVSYYKHQKEIRAMIPQDALCVVGNDDSHFILLYYIDRKGWTFDHDQMDATRLSYLMSKGAKYLFTDNGLDNDAAVKELISEKIFDKDNLRVYKLK